MLLKKIQKKSWKNISHCTRYDWATYFIYCARPSHTDRHFVSTASCVKTTLALPTKKLGCHEIETNILSAYENYAIFCRHKLLIVLELVYLKMEVTVSEPCDVIRVITLAQQEKQSRVSSHILSNMRWLLHVIISLYLITSKTIWDYAYRGVAITIKAFCILNKSFETCVSILSIINIGLLFICIVIHFRANSYLLLGITMLCVLRVLCVCVLIATN